MELGVVELVKAAQRRLRHVLAPLVEQQLDELLVDLLDLPSRRLREVVVGEVDLELVHGVADLVHLEDREGVALRHFVWICFLKGREKKHTAV